MIPNAAPDANSSIAEHLKPATAMPIRKDNRIKALSFLFVIAICACGLYAASLHNAVTDATARLQDANNQLQSLQAQNAETLRRHGREVMHYDLLSKQKIANDKSIDDDRQALIAAFNKIGIYPSDGARITNSILGRMKRLSMFFSDDFRYPVTDENNNVTRPIQGLAFMRGISEELCKKSDNPNCILSSLAHQFGDEEARYILQLDIASLFKNRAVK